MAPRPNFTILFGGVPGSYQRTLDAVGWCHEAGLPVQVNTAVSRRNFADLDNMIELLSSLRVVLWSVFFLVPTGRAQLSDLLSAEEHEQVFAKLYSASKRVKFHIKTTEGQHYRRYVLQQKALVPNARSQEDLITSSPKGVNDGKGVRVREPHRRSLSQRISAACGRKCLVGTIGADISGFVSVPLAS